MDHLSIDIYISICMPDWSKVTGVGVPRGWRGLGGISGGPGPKACPKGYSRDFTIFKRLRSQNVTKSQKKVAHFVRENGRARTTPIQKMSPQHFLATCTAFCIFTPQIWSVSMCRDEDNSSSHLPCQADSLPGSNGCCLAPHLRPGGHHHPQWRPPGPSNA